MCGRFTITHPNDALSALFAAEPANNLPEAPRYNICPTQPVAAVVSVEGRRRFGTMRWGFLPSWYKAASDTPLLINARSETIAEKPAFREACRARRCLIPATGFYEWTKDEGGQRLPWYFTPSDEALLVFAGIWQVWARAGQRHVTCAIVTTAAGPVMSQTHHREPVRLAPSDWARWLGETDQRAAPLMTAAPDTYYRRWRVDPAVNSNRAEGAQLVAPLAG